jgi:hypothetical protein
MTATARLRDPPSLTAKSKFEARLVSVMPAKHMDVQVLRAQDALEQPPTEAR